MVGFVMERVVREREREMDEKKERKERAQKETDLSRPFVATAVASDVGRIGKAVVVNFHSQQSPPARPIRGAPS
jgi:hypothetical protein